MYEGCRLDTEIRDEAGQSPLLDGTRNDVKDCRARNEQQYQGRADEQPEIGCRGYDDLHAGSLSRLIAMTASGAESGARIVTTARPFRRLNNSKIEVQIKSALGYKRENLLCIGTQAMAVDSWQRKDDVGRPLWSPYQESEVRGQ